MATKEQQQKAAATAVAVRESAALVTEEDAALLRGDAGTNTFRKEDLATPFLRVLQPLSPQVVEGNTAQLAGAKAGMFLNSVTQELFDGKEGITIIPVSFTPSYIEWIPRKRGGGLVRDYGADPSAYDSAKLIDEKGHRFTGDPTKDGNEIVKSLLYYILLLKDREEGLYEQMVFSLYGTQAKKGRFWNTQMANMRELDAKGWFNPASYYRTYTVRTVTEQKDNNTWFGVVIEPSARLMTFDKATGKFVSEVPHGPALYKAAKDFCQMAQAGKVRVVQEGEEVEATIEPEGADLPY